MFTGKDNISLILLGIIVHIIYFASVFHIYFRSPIIHGVKEAPPVDYSPANRIVFVVADGLPAEKLFHQKYRNYAPFLRQIIDKEGVWGVSHTRVPTESRVGHVSMFAGTFEDVSAITNGWKDNPVEFDHAFAKTKASFAWGSPDILSIFSKHTSSMTSFSYEADNIDFAGKDPSKLDTWVFDNVAKFFKKVNLQKIPKNKVLFFLHLLGLDTNGHAQKPDSKKYLENLRIVDNGVKNISELFAKVFKDGDKTTFILTSDHGMTPWGAHGTGLPSETETPFVAWGAGIHRPVKRRNVNSELQSRVWGLEDIQRFDINQVDIPSLLSFLLGVPIPVNSVGSLPVEMLDVTDDVKLDGLFVNVQQILQMYLTHEEKVKNSTFVFRRFYEVEKTFAHKSFIEEIRIKGGQLPVDDAITYYRSIMKKALKGVMYYHQYNKFFYSIIVNIGFIMWIIFLIVNIIEQHTKLVRQTVSRKIPRKVMLILTVFIAVCILLYGSYCGSVLEALLIFYPVAMLIQLYSKSSSIRYILNVIAHRIFSFNIFEDITMFFMTIAAIEILVVAFFHRNILSLINIAFAFIPILYAIRTTDRTMEGKDKIISIVWSISNLVLAVFPQLPVITRDENYALVFLAALIAGVFGLMYTFTDKSRNGIIIGIVTFLLVISLVVKLDVILHIKNGLGLPIYDQIYSWITLITLPFVSLLTEATSFTRLIAVNLSLFVIYLLLAISYDALFLLVLSVAMVTWIFMETSVLKRKLKPISIGESDKILNREHIRIALMFTFYLYLSFFGTGNIASINSFDIATMYCFKTIFNPWVQGCIVFIKLLIPFALVNFYFRTLQNMIDVPVSGCYLLILLVGDVMALNFFFLIKVEGSWLDIGQSLSHFIISLIMICILLPIQTISYYICGYVKLEGTKLHQF